MSGSKGREDAFLRQLAEAMESGVKSFGHIAARKLLGPSGGHIGSATGNSASTGTAGDPGFSTTATTVVLDNPSDAVNFAPDMLVTFSGTQSGGTLLNSGGTLKVGSVDVSQGIITFTGNTGVGDATYLAAEDLADTPSAVFIFRNGDYITGTDLGVAIRSLSSWNPATAVVGSANLFNNVDRGQDERLSGCRLTAAEATGSIKDRIEKLVNKMRNTAGAYDTDYVFIGGVAWLALSQDVQSFGWLNFGKVLEIGAGEIAIMTANGVLKVINEPHMPVGDIRIVTSKNLKMYTYDGFPALVDEDGVSLLRNATTMDYEVRYQAFSCFTVNGRPWTQGYCPSGLTG